MSKVDALRSVVQQRLTAAAEDILRLFERTIAEYEEELVRSVRENERQQKLLDAVLKPEVRLLRAVLSEDVRQDPEAVHIKEEQEQLWSSQKGGQLHGPDPVKSQDDEECTQSSQPHQRLTEENREAEPLASSSAQQMEPESDGGPQLTRASDPDSHQPVNDDDTSDCSEQAEDSDDDWKLSMEPRSDSNPVKLKQTLRNVPFRRPVSDDKTSDSSESETKNSSDWKQTRKPRSHLKRVANNGVPEGGEECNTAKKSLHCPKCKTSDTKDCRHKKSPSGAKLFVCSVSVHSGKKTFRCSVCKKQFINKGDVVKHVRTHTGEKPFSCSVCAKRFTQSTGLSTHMRTHTGEKPFSCSVCSKSFIRRGILARHMRVHTGEKPYCCSVCETRFSLSQSLVKHMRIHTGEKPFHCSLCEKRFTQKGHLTQHMTLHTGEKSFSCHVCAKKFTRQSRVKNHKCIAESSSQ